MWTATEVSNQVGFPLVSHASPADIVAYRAGEPVSRAVFLGEVRQLAARLPPGGTLLNACCDRYHFAVGLGAALLTNNISLLPPSLTFETLTQLRAFAPDMLCLYDDAEPLAGMPCLRYPQDLSKVPCNDPVPWIERTRLVAWIFTSGSTGTPQAHAKHWGALVDSVQAGGRRMGLRDGRCHTLIATVPPQHMFGFEVSVLMALQNGVAFDAGKPFYPADIHRSIESIPSPRCLVTTPYHLRTWLGCDAVLPQLEVIVSATAPLSQSLAQQAERRSGARLFEIYGSTETGQVASRLTAQTLEWQLYPGLRLSHAHQETWVSGGHLTTPQALHDQLESVNQEHFLFLGRTADLVNIAGKRSSLAYLNHQINAIEGVQDAVYCLPPEETIDGVTRLMAFVVAPDLSAQRLKAALRQRVDPLFLPRPLYFVDALPRNASGKLPLDALRALALHCRQKGG